MREGKEVMEEFFLKVELIKTIMESLEDCKPIDERQHGIMKCFKLIGEIKALSWVINDENSNIFNDLIDKMEKTIIEQSRRLN